MYLLEFIKRPLNLWFPTRREGTPQSLGTFLGVYLPSVLQILGVVLFMRLGWITRHIGLFKMISIVLMASLILFITSLSKIAVTAKDF